MRISPFVSGIATGAMAGAVVSMVAAGAMLNPSMRRNAKHAAHKAEHAMHRAADRVEEFIGFRGSPFLGERFRTLRRAGNVRRPAREQKG